MVYYIGTLYKLGRVVDVATRKSESAVNKYFAVIPPGATMKIEKVTMTTKVEF